MKRGKVEGVRSTWRGDDIRSGEDRRKHRETLVRGTQLFTTPGGKMEGTNRRRRERRSS